MKNTELKQVNVKQLKTKIMNTNEILMKYSNLNEILINHVDKLLIERLPDLVEEELKWLRKEYGNDEISNFLERDDYYELSPVLNKLIQIYKSVELKIN